MMGSESACDPDLRVDVMRRAMLAAAMVVGMFEKGEAEIIREEVERYKKESVATRTLAELFGRTAINQTDANVMARIPVVELIAGLIDQTDVIQGPAAYVTPFDRLFESWGQESK